MAFLGKGKLEDLRKLAEGLGEDVPQKCSLKDLKKIILESTDYEEGFAREQLVVIIEERKREIEERIRKEEREERIRKEEREERQREQEYQIRLKELEIEERKWKLAIERKRKEEFEFEERERKWKLEIEKRGRKEELEFEERIIQAEREEKIRRDEQKYQIDLEIEERKRKLKLEFEERRRKTEFEIEERERKWKLEIEERRRKEEFEREERRKDEQAHQIRLKETDEEGPAEAVTTSTEEACVNEVSGEHEDPPTTISKVELRTLPAGDRGKEEPSEGILEEDNVLDDEQSQGLTKTDESRETIEDLKTEKGLGSEENENSEAREFRQLKGEENEEEVVAQIVEVIERKNELKERSISLGREVPKLLRVRCEKLGLNGGKVPFGQNSLLYWFERHLSLLKLMISEPNSFNPARLVNGKNLAPPWIA